MKKPALLLTVLTLLAYLPSRAQTCGAGGIVLSSQAQVNAFSTTYSGCTQLVEGLEITGNDITNLNGLGGITSISGELVIHDSPLLTTLGGLNVTSIAGLRIENLPLVTNLVGLEGLTGIGLVAINCPALADLSGLENVTSIGLYIENTAITDFTDLTSLTSLGYIQVMAPQPNLKNFHGLQGATSMAGGLTVGPGVELTDFTGLDNIPAMFYMDIWCKAQSFNGLGSLQSLVGWLDLYPDADIPNFEGLESISYVERIGSNSPKLTSLKGLETLDSTMFGVSINNSQIQDLDGLQGMKKLSLGLGNNASLTSLTGIENVPLTGLTIQNSPLLTGCTVKSVCAYLAEPANTVTLSGNATACNTRAAIVNSPACQTILPVELLSFTGESTPEGNRLHWKTTWETSNKGFDIERSVNMRDFTKIGFITGHGDSNTQKAYTFTDPATARTVYYRLKQLDEDGSFHYSKTIAVHDNRYAVKVYPNPSKGHLKIDAAQRNQAFSIRNAQGTTVMEASILPAQELDTSGLQNGLYLLSVGDETFKVMVQH